MSTSTMTPNQEIDFLRDALDHIGRLARGSRTGTKRLRWIEERAVLALKGKVPDVPASEMPRASSEETIAGWKRDARRYRKLRHRNELECDFDITDLYQVFGDDMDAMVDALPPRPNALPSNVEAEVA